MISPAGIAAASARIVPLPGLSEAAGVSLLFVLIALAIGALLFSWHRFGPGAVLITLPISLILIGVAVYASGGWSSYLSVSYVAVVIICAVALPARLAMLCVAVTLLASLSPQLYAPDTQRMVESLVLQVPTYAIFAAVSGYLVESRVRRERLRSARKMRQLESDLQLEASTDKLTGVFNRTYFEGQLRNELERLHRLGGNFVLVFLDLDDFKEVNDSHGHRAGDEALKLVAQTLKANARKIDSVARYGGDEFAVLMPGASIFGARNFFERIRQEVAKNSERAFGFPIRLSAGAVECPSYVSSPRDLLDMADAAMYRAKRQGKDRMFTTLHLARGDKKRITGQEG